MRQLLLDKETLVAGRVAKESLDVHSVLIAVSYSYLSSHTKVEEKHTCCEKFAESVPSRVQRFFSSVETRSAYGDIAQLGRSCSGRVLAVGAKVSALRPGDWVACVVKNDTSQSDMVCVPEQFVVKIPNKELLKEASLVAIGAVALESVRRAKLRLGEYVCVYGLGLLGQLTVQLAKLAGCVVIAIDVLEDRLELAQKLGADATVPVDEDDPARAIHMLTEHHGVDAAIVTFTPHDEHFIPRVIKMTRQKGRLVVVSESDLVMQSELLAEKEIDLVFSTRGGAGVGGCVCDHEQDYPYAYMRWTEQRNMRAFIDFVANGSLQVSSFVQDQASPDQTAAAVVRVHENKTLGVVLACCCRSEVAQIDSHAAQKSVQAPVGYQFTPATQGQMRVGVVGMDDYTAHQLIPVINALSGVTVGAVVRDHTFRQHATSIFADEQKSYISEQELLEDDAVDVVLITSPKGCRVDRLLHFMRSGKAVFARGTVVSSDDDLQCLSSFLNKNKQAPFCVDHSLSFSPFASKIKGAVAKRRAPMMVHYRANRACYEESCPGSGRADAGRIIGDACHIIDLFCFLTDARPVAVAVEALHLSRKDVFPTDNFCAQISFDDGSVCSLFYSIVGHHELGADRMELFFDGKAIMFDDYVSMYGFGLSRMFNETVPVPDRGNEALLRQFFRSLTNDSFDPPIDFDRLKTVAELTLIIDQLACGGGGKKSISLT